MHAPSRAVIAEPAAWIGPEIQRVCCTPRGAVCATEIQREALETVQAIANQPELMLSMDFQEGDIQLINNHTMLHAREAYEDHPEPGRERHLLRMWIAVDDARRRPLAPALEGRYRWVRAGGIPLKVA